MSFDFETVFVIHSSSSISKFPAFLKILYPIIVIGTLLGHTGTHVYLHLYTCGSRFDKTPACRPVRLSGWQNVRARRGVVDAAYGVSSARCVSAPRARSLRILELAPGGGPGRRLPRAGGEPGSPAACGGAPGRWHVFGLGPRGWTCRGFLGLGPPTRLAGPRANSALCVSPPPSAPGLVPEPAR